MAQARGICSSVIIDFETTYGSDPGTPAGIQMPFNTMALRASRTLVEPQTITANVRHPSQPIHGNTDVRGPGVVPLDQIHIGYWLRALIGDAATTGSAAPYTHVFKPGDCTAPIESMVVQLGFVDITEYIKFNGVKIDSMSVTVGGDGEALANMEFIGAKETVSASDYDATPTTLTFSRFNQFQAALEEGGSSIAYVGTLNFTMSNSLDPESFVIGGGGIRGALPEGHFKVTGSVRAFWQDSDLYDKAVATTETSLKATFTSGSYSLEFFFPELHYQRGGPVIETPGGIWLEMPFYAYYDDNADTSVAKVTLINTHASYA